LPNSASKSTKYAIFRREENQHPPVFSFSPFFSPSISLPVGLAIHGRAHDRAGARHAAGGVRSPPPHRGSTPRPLLKRGALSSHSSSPPLAFPCTQTPSLCLAPMSRHRWVSSELELARPSPPSAPTPLDCQHHLRCDPAHPTHKEWPPFPFLSSRSSRRSTSASPSAWRVHHPFTAVAHHLPGPPHAPDHHHRPCHLRAPLGRPSPPSICHPTAKPELRRRATPSHPHKAGRCSLGIGITLLEYLSGTWAR